MKKIALIATLVLAASAASAADLMAFGRYDYDNATSTSKVDLNRGTVGVAASFGQYGTIDAGLVGARLRTQFGSGSDQGIEVGYSNGTTFGKLGVSGRLGYARYNETSLDVLRLSTEVTYPLAAGVVAVAGVEHIRAENDAVANRFSVGTDLAVAKNVSTRIAATRTNFTGSSVAANGLTIGVSYKF